MAIFELRDAWEEITRRIEAGGLIEEQLE